jgi:CheY-like chemotaxis protein
MESKILIVDDDTSLLYVLETLFKDERHDVTTCANGKDAIRMFTKQSFDLVITDIMMPGATGLDVLREVRKTSPDTLVILITGFASLETAIKAIREGAYDYIAKPFKLEEIKIVVRNAIEKITLTRENRKLLDELQGAYEQLHLVREMVQKDCEDEAGGNGKGAGDTRGKTLFASDALPYHVMADNLNHRTSFIMDLERISRLKNGGFISEKEFDQCKSRLFQSLKS